MFPLLAYLLDQKSAHGDVSIVSRRHENQNAPLEEEYGMTTPQRFRRYLRVLFAASAMILATVTAEAAVHYITQGGGAITKDGKSWMTAYDEAAFPAAILSANVGDEIWVKAGVYRPSITNDATKSFVLKNGVAVYGGFAGTETSSADRDPAANVTVLTGDLANDDTHDMNGVTTRTVDIDGENSACVVTAASGCGPTTVLDGFTVTAGDNSNNGGGMSLENSSPTVKNCTFSGNRTSDKGGGVATSNSNAVFEDCRFSGNSSTGNGGGMTLENGSHIALSDCTFTGNTADHNGGGMSNIDSYPTVSGCTFSGNAAPHGNGGGMHNENSSPIVTNCTFSGNSANAGCGMSNHRSGSGSGSAPAVRNCTFYGNTALIGDGGGMGSFYNGTAVPVVTNCVFWGNTGFQIVSGGALDAIVSYSVVNGDYPGGTNIFTDNPNLGPLADNGGPTKTHALLPGSSAIDKGATIPTISCDQRGVTRPQGVSFDIGAYEYWEKQILTVKTVGNGSVAPSPLGDVVGTIGKCWGYANGTTVTLTASEDARSCFDAWSGDASGTNLTTTVTMNDPRTVEASFDVAWLVTASAGPGGDIAESAPGSGSSGLSAPGGRGAGTTTFKVRNGANKTFTVAPDAGYSIGSVRLNGTIDLGAVSTYTLTNVSADHTLEATFTANPTPTLTPTPVVTPSATPVPTTAPTDAPAPTAAPTTNPTSTPAPTATPTPVPTPDPDIPLPTVTLTITLYAGGTIVAGPFDISDPTTLTALLSSQTLLAQLLATDPAAILSGTYNMDLVRFFSLVADLDDGVLDFTILFEVKVEGVPAGYRAQVFVLARTFDSNGRPTGYLIVPRNEGANVFRKRSGARGWTETWRVTIQEGGATDGDAKQDGSVAPQIAAVVAVFPQSSPTPTMTPTQGSTGGGGCSLPANGPVVLAALLLLAPVILMRRR